MHEGEKINKRLCKFFIEIFEFTDEQLAAIDYQIPMTQEIYNSVLDRCMELGTAADDLFNRMLLEYPDFIDANSHLSSKVRAIVPVLQSHFDFACSLWTY